MDGLPLIINLVANLAQLHIRPARSPRRVPCSRRSPSLPTFPPWKPTLPLRHFTIPSSLHVTSDSLRSHRSARLAAIPSSSPTTPPHARRSPALRALSASTQLSFAATRVRLTTATAHLPHSTHLSLSSAPTRRTSRRAAGTSAVERERTSAFDVLFLSPRRRSTIRI